MRNIAILILISLSPLISFSQSETGIVAKKLNYQIVNFSRNLELLANTKFDKKERGYNERIILNQFASKNAKLEVTDLHQNTIKVKTVKEYLSELINETAKISIEISNIEIKEDEFKMIGNNKLQCYVRYEQVFKKHMDGELIYHDITKKAVETQAIRKIIDPSDTTLYSWDIKFKSIKIEGIKNVLTGAVYEIQDNRVFFDKLNSKSLIKESRIESKVWSAINIAIPDTVEFIENEHARLEFENYKAIPAKLTNMIEVERSIALSNQNINIPANCVKLSLDEHNKKDIIYKITLTPNDIGSVLEKNILIYDNTTRDDMSLEFLVKYFGEYINILSSLLNVEQTLITVTGKADAIPVNQYSKYLYNFNNSNIIESKIYSANYKKDTSFRITRNTRIDNQGLAFIRAYKTKEYLIKTFNNENIKLAAKVSDQIEENDRGIEIEVIFKNALQKQYNSMHEKSKELVQN